MIHSGFEMTILLQGQRLMMVKDVSERSILTILIFDTCLS